MREYTGYLDGCRIFGGVSRIFLGGYCCGKIIRSKGGREGGREGGR